MYMQRQWILLSISVVIILVLTAFALPARGMVFSGTPGGFLSFIDDTMIDPMTGDEYTISLIARELDYKAGTGRVTFLLKGPSLSICSAHGPGAEIDFSAGGEDFGGNFPVQDIQCGTGYSMALSVDECTAKTELHGYLHSDQPFYAFMGPTTFDLTFRKIDAASGQATLKIYTPKGPIKLTGNVSGSIEMDTCP